MSVVNKLEKLPPRDGWNDVYLVSISEGSIQALEKSDVIAVNKDVNEGVYFAVLVNEAVFDPWELDVEL